LGFYGKSEAMIDDWIAEWRKKAAAYYFIGKRPPYDLARFIAQLEIIRDQKNGVSFAEIERKSAEIIPFPKSRKRASSQ
jgi:hypothetical protein